MHIMKINSNEALILLALREMDKPRWAQKISREVMLSVNTCHAALRSMAARGLVTTRDSRDENGARRIEFTATAKAGRLLASLKEALA
jgi:DNA-binding MarR family transcriptional regulator